MQIPRLLNKQKQSSLIDGYVRNEYKNDIPACINQLFFRFYDQTIQINLDRNQLKQLLWSEGKYCVERKIDWKSVIQIKPSRDRHPYFGCAHKDSGNRVRNA